MSTVKAVHRRFLSKRWSDRKVAFLLVAPPVLFLLAFTLYPIIRIFWMSMHDISITEPWLGQPFTGFENYAKAFRDGRFWHSLGFTLSFSTVTVVFELVIGLYLASIANRTFRFRGFVRAAILFPWALPTITNALTWRWMFNQDYGLINGLLLMLGFIKEPLNWLGDSTLAYIAICIVAIWKTSSFMAIILLAGLQSIPGNLYEAARIDGAGRVQMLVRITLPLLRNVILVSLILRTLAAMQAFDLMYGLTQGGPGNDTESLPMYIYATTFVDMQWGYGSALGVLLFIVLLLISMIYIKWLYDGDR